jgi:hypothetical protein
MSGFSIRGEAQDASQESDRAFDLQALLHPAGAFAHPSDVVRDPDLTLNEKRAILASWASDACAVESAPALRIAPAGSRPVTFDDVMDALRVLDEQAAEYGKTRPHYRHVLADRVPGVFGRKTHRRQADQRRETNA